MLVFTMPLSNYIFKSSLGSFKLSFTCHLLGNNKGASRPIRECGAASAAAKSLLLADPRRCPCREFSGCDSKKSKNMSKYTIVMVRHGESEWNQQNLFCGWYDANLSDKGTIAFPFRAIQFKIPRSKGRCIDQHSGF